jgi:hypothetical protein
MIKKSILNVIATGKYEKYIDGIVNSSIKNFLRETELKIIVYTDSKKILKSNNKNIIPIKIDYESWPYPTLKRFHYFDLALEHIEKSDYSFYIDVDSFFRKKIDLKKLGLLDFPGIVGTIHPGFYGSSGTPETRKESTAYIPENYRFVYHCGGFFGGNSQNFIHLAKTIKNNIDQDLSKNIIAIWHDESHLNRYFLDYPPIKSMGKGFSSPEEFLGQEKYKDPYIVFIDKSEDLKNDKK